MALTMIPPILSMLATLAIAYGVDLWIFLQFNLGKPLYLRVTTAAVGAVLGGLITCLLWVLFCWLVLVKNRPAKAASILFILAGLLAFIWFPLEVLSPFWARYLYFFPVAPTNFQYTGLLAVALGIMTLIVQKHNSEKPQSFQ
jgi:hypothetical protein